MPTNGKPDWRRVYWDRFIAVRRRLLREVRDGIRPYLDYVDLQAQARDTAQRDVEHAINEYYDTGEDHPQDFR